jgi:hypothetical protein
MKYVKGWNRAVTPSTLPITTTMQLYYDSSPAESVLTSPMTEVHTMHIIMRAHLIDHLPSSRRTRIIRAWRSNGRT